MTNADLLKRIRENAAHREASGETLTHEDVLGNRREVSVLREQIKVVPTQTLNAAIPRSPLALINTKDIPPLHEYDTAVLTDEEIARVVAEAQFFLQTDPRSIEFTKRVDTIHLRAKTGAGADLGDCSDNVSLTVAILQDLSDILGDLFPETGRRGSAFKALMQEAKPAITNVMTHLDYAKHALKADLNRLDAYKEQYRTGVTALRKALLVTRTLRVQIDNRLVSMDKDARAALESTVVYHLAQREQDILMEIAVTAQALVAIDPARATLVSTLMNTERVLSITMFALHNAVYVATNVEASTIDYMMDARKIIRSTGQGFDATMVKSMLSNVAEARRLISAIPELPVPPKSVRLPH